MKIKFLIVCLSMLVLLGCSDGESPYTCSSCSDEPDALAANDNSGKGIYKGVVVGSSGTIIIDMDNGGGGQITGTLIIDDEEIQLATEDTYVTGFDGNFYGTLNTANDVQVGFMVSGIGNFISISNVIIPGHPDAEIQVVKEVSSQLVEIFEGSFQGDESGTLNFIVARDEEGTGDWSALGFSTEIKQYEGYLQRNGFFGGGGSVSINGAIDGDRAGGAWEDTNGDSGTWKGKRTL
jgi:hypothetical protein